MRWPAFPIQNQGGWGHNIMSLGSAWATEWDLPQWNKQTYKTRNGAVQTERAKLEVVFACNPVLWKLTKDRHWSTRGRCYCDKELPPRLTSQHCCLEELGFWHRNFGETCPDHRKKQVPPEWPRNHISFSKELEATLICIRVEHLLWLLSFSVKQRTADAD